MKSLKLGTTAALAVTFGIGLAVFGFLPEPPALRTALHALGVAIAALGIYLCQQLVAHWEKMRAES